MLGLHRGGGLGCRLDLAQEETSRRSAMSKTHDYNTEFPTRNTKMIEIKNRTNNGIIYTEFSVNTMSLLNTFGSIARPLCALSSNLMHRLILTRPSRAQVFTLGPSQKNLWSRHENRASPVEHVAELNFPDRTRTGPSSLALIGTGPERGPRQDQLAYVKIKWNACHTMQIADNRW
ncbi:hypothetical protein Ddc_18086 [Ditylenchus destructor]|nr:hypothetical protein Ddc_18086 [Ditylenchus destructor]